MEARDHYDYFDHDADIGIIGQGTSITDAFVAAAKGVFAIMTDINHIERHETIAVDFVEGDPELALVVWLNLLLAKAREHGLMFGDFELSVKGATWHGRAHGMAWEKHLTHGVEVKGATLTALCVYQHQGIWEARCIVDV